MVSDNAKLEVVSYQSSSLIIGATGLLDVDTVISKNDYFEVKQFKHCFNEQTKSYVCSNFHWPFLYRWNFARKLSFCWSDTINRDHRYDMILYRLRLKRLHIQFFKVTELVMSNMVYPDLKNRDQDYFVSGEKKIESAHTSKGNKLENWTGLYFPTEYQEADPSILRYVLFFNLTLLSQPWRYFSYND